VASLILFAEDKPEGDDLDAVELMVRLKT